MNTMKVLPAISSTEARQFETNELRSNFLLNGIHKTGEINLTYTHYDRLIAGVAVPAGHKLVL